MTRASRDRADLHARLPYGVWRERGGCEVLFNRAYEPMYRRTPDGIVTAVTSPTAAGNKIWIKWIAQNHFYNDGDTPWGNRATRARCEAILAEWGIAL